MLSSKGAIQDRVEIRERNFSLGRVSRNCISYWYNHCRLCGELNNSLYLFQSNSPFSSCMNSDWISSGGGLLRMMARISSSLTVILSLLASSRHITSSTSMDQIWSSVRNLFSLCFAITKRRYSWYDIFFPSISAILVSGRRRIPVISKPHWKNIRPANPTSAITKTQRVFLRNVCIILAS